MKALDHTTWLKEGRQFLQIAQRSYQSRNKLTPEILYNVLGLAVEKCLMAALDMHGRLPDNHTFTDLIDATKQVGEIDVSIADQLRKFESYQNICPVFAGYHRAELPDGAILEMIATAEAVQTWAEKMIAA